MRPLRSITLFLAMCWFTAIGALGQQELQRGASWQITTEADVQSRVKVWIEQSADSQDAARTVITLLEDREAMARRPLDQMARVIQTTFPTSTELIKFLQQPYDHQKELAGEDAPENRLSELELPHTARNELRLLIGRWYVQNLMFDEGLHVLNQLTTDDVIDRASLLFYRGLCQQQLRQKEECIASLERLLENQSDLSDRFRIVAQLMLADVNALQQDTLEEISRMMDDIHRRQSLFRSGTRVRELEQEVIDKLDQMISELEEQMQNAGGEGSGQNAAPKPMQESQNAGGKGDGKVTDKGLEDGGSWGEIPPQDRAAALQEMTKDLPPHYREVIEEYFRQLARMAEDK